MKKFFVYGTLKEGGRFAGQVAHKLKSAMPAKIMGTMFSIGGSYPGVVLKGKTEIQGEIHQFEDEKDVERALDRIEGHYGPGHPSNLYEKSTVMATLPDGSKEEVMLYTFAQSVKGYKEVESGVWEI